MACFRFADKITSEQHRLPGACDGAVEIVKGWRKLRPMLGLSPFADYEEAEFGGMVSGGKRLGGFINVSSFGLLVDLACFGSALTIEGGTKQKD